MEKAVLNGSPKGDMSVTMQYMQYLEKKFPGHTFIHENISELISPMEGDRSIFDRVIGSVRRAGAVIWATPVYFMLVFSQYLRFIDLVRKRGEKDVFRGRNTCVITTSVPYFDHTAHEFLHGTCDDLGMRYLGSYSAAMGDLLDGGERKRFLAFFSRFLEDAGRNLPIQRAHLPLPSPALQYVPETAPRPVDTRKKRIVILTESQNRESNLWQMTERLLATFGPSAEVFSLDELDIRGGCLGCIRCGYDNTCVYRCCFHRFFTEFLCKADILVFCSRLHGRFIAPRWKMFPDRSFFRGHTPVLSGKQIAWLIEGPLSHASPTREVLTAWAESERAGVHFVSDEVSLPSELDRLLDTLASTLVRDASLGYIPPPTFRSHAGAKVFRDMIR